MNNYRQKSIANSLNMDHFRCRVKGSNRVWQHSADWTGGVYMVAVISDVLVTSKLFPNEIHVIVHISTAAHTCSYFYPVQFYDKVSSLRNTNHTSLLLCPSQSVFFQPDAARPGPGRTFVKC